MTATQQRQEPGQIPWLENINPRPARPRDPLAHHFNKYSMTRLTSSPTIFDTAIEAGAAYDSGMAAWKAADASEADVTLELARTCGARPTCSRPFTNAGMGWTVMQAYTDQGQVEARSCAGSDAVRDREKLNLDLGKILEGQARPRLRRSA